MRLTEREIDNAIRNAINEYGNNWDYPMGADNDSAPWNQVDAPMDSEEYDCPVPTTQMLLYVAKEIMDIEDPNKLSEIKMIGSKLPQEVVVYGCYDIPYEWERNEDGGSKNYLYDDVETLDLATCVKEGEGQYTYLPRWAEDHKAISNQEELELLKSIVKAFDNDLKDNHIDPRDFEGYSEYNYLDDIVNAIKGYNISRIGVVEEPEQNVMNEATMRNFIYEKVLKALDECCK